MVFTKHQSFKLFLQILFMLAFSVSLFGCSSGGDGATTTTTPTTTAPTNTSGTFDGTGFGFGIGEVADPSVEIWEFTSDDLKNVTSPAIAADKTIYVGSLDKKLYALHSDGSVKWRYNTETGTGIEHAPAVGTDGTIYFVDIAATLYALNPDGSKKWSISNIGTTGIAIADNGTVLVAEYALNPNDGSVIWDAGYSSEITPVVNSSTGLVYLARNTIRNFSTVSDIKAHSLADGTELWTINADGRVFYSPAIGDDNTIYFGDSVGAFYAIDHNGNELWKKIVDATEIALTTPVIGQNGDIYIEFTDGSGDGRIYTFASDGTMKWSFRVAFRSQAPVVGIDGTIYIATNTLTALNDDGTIKWDAITYSNGRSAPIIDSDGFLFTPLSSTLYKLDVKTGGASTSPWPMDRSNIRNTASKS